MPRPIRYEYDTQAEYLEAMQEYEMYLDIMEERAEDREACCQGWD